MKACTTIFLRINVQATEDVLNIELGELEIHYARQREDYLRPTISLRMISEQEDEGGGAVSLKVELGHLCVVKRRPTSDSIDDLLSTSDVGFLNQVGPPA